MRTHGFAPLIVSQLTHSGRYVKTNNTPTPVIAQHNAWIEKEHPLPDSCVISDDRLKYYEEQFGKGAALAKRSGFDGVDIKCAHFYLASELLSAYERSGEYGGCFENRTRFIRNCLRAAKPAADQNFSLPVASTPATDFHIRGALASRKMRESGRITRRSMR